jgi:hypothetical protein
VDGEMVVLAGPESFEVVPLDLATFEAEDRAEVLAFRRKLAELQRAVHGAIRAGEEAETRLAHLRKAFVDTPAAKPALLAEIHDQQQRLNELLTRLRGDRTREKRYEPRPPSVRQRVDEVVSNQWQVTSPPTKTQRDSYANASAEFAQVLSDLRQLLEVDLVQLEDKLEAAGAPWTPGRLPDWNPE